MTRHDRNEVWTVVNYRRGRQVKRYEQPPRHDYSNDHDSSRRHRPSYASVTRADRRVYRDEYPRRYNRHNGNKPQFFDRRTQYQADYHKPHTGTEAHDRFAPRYRDRFAPRYHDRGTDGPEQRPRRPPRVPDSQRDRPLSDDPDFTVKVRILHRIIKTVHHLKNVSGEEPPTTIERMTKTLSTFIKPASPSPATTQLIDGNARHWAHTTLLILRDHYDRSLDAEVERLAALTTPDFEEPFQVATIWARRNLGRRLLPETLEQSEAVIIAKLSDLMATETTDHPPATTDRSPAMTAVTRAIKSTRSSGTRPGTTHDHVAPPNSAATTQPRPSYTAAQVHTVPQSLPDLTSQPQITAPRTLQGTTTTSPTTPTEPNRDWTPEPSEEHENEDQEIPPVPPLNQRLPRPVEATPCMPPQSSNKKTPPLPQRLSSSTNPCVALQRTDISTLPDLQSLIQREPTLAEKSTTPRSSPERQVEDEDEEGGSEPADSENGSPTRAAAYSLEPDHATSEPDCSEDTQPESPTAASQTLLPYNRLTRLGTMRLDRAAQTRLSLHTAERSSSPQTPLYKPTRHPQTEHKSRDWSLHIVKKWVVLGDSNISRIPSFTSPDLQMDSYPGASFPHAEAILSTATNAVTVEKIVLSFGLLHKGQNNPGTAVKELQKLLRTAKNRFPHAEILVPEINFSKSLPLMEQKNLTHLNHYIFEHCNSLLPLPQTQFHTDRDKVHWTATTALAIFKLWSESLN